MTPPKNVTFSTKKRSKTTKHLCYYKHSHEVLVPMSHTSDTDIVIVNTNAGLL